jgi:6-phosphogluconolactonase
VLFRVDNLYQEIGMLRKAAVVLLICASMTIGVGCVSTSSRWVYASLPQSDQIVAYREDPNSGILTVLSQSPIAAGPAVQSLVIHPSKKYLYAANSGANNVSLFTVAADGSLAESSSRINVGTSPTLLAMDSAGKYLFVGNSGSNDVWVFTIDPGTGFLTQLGSSYQLGLTPLNMKLSPSGNFLYVTAGSQLAGTPGSLDVLSFNPAAVSPQAPFTIVAPITQPGSGPYGIAIDPSGAHLYTSNFSDNTISEFTINSDGSLSSIQGSPVGETYVSPISVFIDPSGKYLYVANQGSGNLAGYTINSDGTLTLLTNSPFPTGAQPTIIATDPSGKYLFVGNQSNAVIQPFTLDTSNGTLTSITTYTLGGTPTSIAVSP